MNLEFTHVKGCGELGKDPSFFLKKVMSSTPNHCSGPAFSPYLASYAPLALPEAETYLGKLLNSPEKDSWKCSRINEPWPPQSPVPGTVKTSHFLLLLGPYLS